MGNIDLLGEDVFSVYGGSGELERDMLERMERAILSSFAIPSSLCSTASNSSSSSATTMKDLVKAAAELKKLGPPEPSVLSMRDPLMIYASPSITKDQADEACEMIAENRWDRKVPQSHPSLHLEPGTVIIADTAFRPFEFEFLRPIDVYESPPRFLSRRCYGVAPITTTLPWTFIVSNLDFPAKHRGRRCEIKLRRDGHLHRQRRRP